MHISEYLSGYAFENDKFYEHKYNFKNNSVVDGFAFCKRIHRTVTR